MRKKQIIDFLLLARTKTYAGSGAETKPLLSGSRQYESRQGEWLYRDIFYIGQGRFTGLETIYYRGKPVYSSSYFGNFSAMTEAEIDKVLRQALISKQKETRLWHQVEWKDGDFTYRCAGDGTMEEFSGTEEIYKKGKQVYYFYYASGLIG